MLLTRWKWWDFESLLLILSSYVAHKMEMVGLRVVTLDYLELCCSQDGNGVNVGSYRKVNNPITVNLKTLEEIMNRQRHKHSQLESLVSSGKTEGQMCGTSEGGEMKKI
ncbi:hypothetical protein RRG08_032500 [Elysia crispata]|uniref:Uncharacterized protein n=1 Tax=Elysia crispata TaxID=231223 RepID=A0AAE0ZYM0_9GAST|nr:hypothetical protein RRG08_032500 [Elysia crispata]